MRSESDGLAPSADLQIAVIDLSSLPWTCGTFSDDLSSPAITISEATGPTQPFRYCLRNIGSQTVNVTVQVEELDDLEIGCTGDENIYDTTCGSGQGELGEVVRASYQVMECDFSTSSPSVTAVLRDQLVTPVSLGTLGHGRARCYFADAFISYQNEVQRQQIQSDRLTWRFAWTGQV